MGLIIIKGMNFKKIYIYLLSGGLSRPVAAGFRGERT